VDNETLKEAKRINKNYDAKLRRMTIKTRNGEKDAALNFIKLLTEQALALKAIGYWVNDDGKLEKITEKSRLTKLTEIREKHGDPTDAVKFLKSLMS
jgi:hypothetical protein